MTSQSDDLARKACARLLDGDRGSLSEAQDLAKQALELAEEEAETAARKAKSAQQEAEQGGLGQARAQRDSIVSMVANLEPVECERCGRWHRDLAELEDYPGGLDIQDEPSARTWCDSKLEDHETADTEDDARDAAREAIEQDALCVQVRGPWHTPGSEHVFIGQPAEYEITLCTGGPAVRLVGELENSQPTTARLEYQDWFTPWIAFEETSQQDDAALLAYAQVFYFGEG